MSWKFVDCDPKKCLGCYICEYVCSTFKDNTTNPIRSRIRVINAEPDGSMAITCRLCENPPCTRSCPRDALRQDEKTGVIIVDEDKCTGCGWCVESCDFGAIFINPAKGVATICDLCDGDPECIKLCPFNEALSMETTYELAHSLRKSAFERLLKEPGEV